MEGGRLHTQDLEGGRQASSLLAALRHQEVLYTATRLYLSKLPPFHMPSLMSGFYLGNFASGGGGGRMYGPRGFAGGENAPPA